jgi:predicted aconitase
MKNWGVFLVVALTLDEQEMLNGQRGKLKQQAMRKIVEYAEILNAKELCEVGMAHLFCGAHGYLAAAGDLDVEGVVSVMQYCSDGPFPPEEMACYCQSDCGPMDPVDYRKMNCTDEEAERNQQFLDYYRACGINLVGTCVPYLCGFIPLPGEHYVSSESHAVTLMNSLWGACGNADGLEAGFWAAACGRIPKWGNHIKEDRLGTHVFDVATPIENSLDWDLLGYTVGRKLPPHSVPVITGLKRLPSISIIKYFFAAMATTSGPEMCHLVGITPEAPTIETALGGQKPVGRVTISKSDLRESLKILGGGTVCGETVDYISLGCPHYSIEELKSIAMFLDGKKVSKGTVVHIWTAPPIKNIADNNGYTKIIEASGAALLTSSCPLTSGKLPPNVGVMAFDSAKQAHYMTPGQSAKVLYGSLMTCLKAATAGKWGD